MGALRSTLSFEMHGQELRNRMKKFRWCIITKTGNQRRNANSLPTKLYNLRSTTNTRILKRTVVFAH